MKRHLVIAILVLSLSAFPSLALASPPVGTCPPPFELRSFSQISGAPPGFLEAIDLNEDERVCVKPHPQGGLIVIDNTAQVP